MYCCLLERERNDEHNGVTNKLGDEVVLTPKCQHAELAESYLNDSVPVLNEHTETCH